MNVKQFVDEAKHSGLVQKEFLEIYDDFQKYQNLAIGTLQAFSQVCERNEIAYQLAWGSLLGAIRDGGQIPWDYDVDVFVPYKEKNRLVEALKNDLDRQYYFYCPEIDPQCRHFFIRVTPKEYRSDILHVDVFYVVGAPDDVAERQIFCQRLARLSHMRYEKLVNPLTVAMGRPKAFVKACLQNLKMLSTPLKKIEKEYIDMCTRYDYDQAKYLVSADIFAIDATFFGDEIRQTIEYSTDHGVYPIPVGYDQILKSLYQNYMQVPSLESRLNELYSHYRQLSQYAKMRNSRKKTEN